MPDATWGERPLILIVPVGGAEAARIELAITAAYAEMVDAGGLSKWAVPEKIRFVSEIAKTSVGKIDKKALRATLG